MHALDYLIPLSAKVFVLSEMLICEPVILNAFVFYQSHCANQSQLNNLNVNIEQYLKFFYQLISTLSIIASMAFMSNNGFLVENTIITKFTVNLSLI